MSLFLHAVPVDATILPYIVFAVTMTKELRGELSKSAPATCDTWRYVAVSLHPSQQKAWSSSDRGLSNHDPICLMGIWGLINTWILYEFVSIWPTGNGEVKPTIINLSTCCKWTKSLINPRVAQCFVVNIGGGEMLVRKDELPHGSICLVTTSQRLFWLLVTKACSFRKLHNYLIRSNLILSSTDATSLDNWW